MVWRTMLAQTHQEVFLRSFFAKKRPLAPQRIGVFFESFLLRLLCQKKAEFRTEHQNYCKLIIVTFNPDVLFLFLSCEREKEPKREDSPLSYGDFARCDERQGLRALDWRHLAGGGLQGCSANTPLQTLIYR